MSRNVNTTQSTPSFDLVESRFERNSRLSFTYDVEHQLINNIIFEIPENYDYLTFLHAIGCLESFLQRQIQFYFNVNGDDYEYDELAFVLSGRYESPHLYTTAHQEVFGKI
ncbi:hypothetical protein phiOC_p224 [Ochrobactrum phage vB_OspM_OC]|nr:hypothetical protein phiOC_p224 [Ochrobactrum phage vB_OspM_OC]